MAIYAPEYPTVTQLEASYPLATHTAQRIAEARSEVSDVLTRRKLGLLAIIGPCAMTEERAIINREGDELYALQQQTSGLYTAHRAPPWKPRSNDADWHGLESEDATVETAYQTIAERADSTANIALEIGHAEHLKRYGPRTTLGWSGSRNAEDDLLIQAIADYDPTLPIGVKNDMHGNIKSALGHVATINHRRAGIAHAAPAVLVYRGGDHVRTPETWEHGYREALERTNGMLIVDLAHGGEMAHDPHNSYGKSSLGQIACMEHVISIAEQYGELPCGVMLEATDAPTPTDPVIPFSVACSGVMRLHGLATYR